MPISANVDRIRINRSHQSVEEISITNIEFMGKGAALAPEEEKILSEKVTKLLTSMPFESIRKSFKLEKIIKGADQKI